MEALRIVHRIGAGISLERRADDHAVAAPAGQPLRKVGQHRRAGNARQARGGVVVAVGMPKNFTIAAPLLRYA